MRSSLAAMVLAGMLAGVAWCSVARAQAVKVDVTGQPLEVNGYDAVPAALFGVHAMGRKNLTAKTVAEWGIEMQRVIHWRPSGNVRQPSGELREAGLNTVIDCQGDRYCPALVLTDPDFAQTLTKMGTDYAKAASAAKGRHLVEFWNEPYLNWASKSAINYRPQYYDVSKAKVGGPVTIKGWDKPVPHARWVRKLRAVDDKGKVNYEVTVPGDAREGQSFKGYDKFRRRTGQFTVKEVWEVEDPTQVAYWSGELNLAYYLWMLEPFAKAVKQADPDVPVIAGWDFHIYSRGWSAFEQLYKPVIDKCGPWLDGVTEHHYGSDVRATGATAEVVAGYGMAKHGRWLRTYNTETAGQLDPQIPGNQAAAIKQAGLDKALGSFTYSVRDVMHALHFTPDKFAARAAHSPDNNYWGAPGNERFFKLFRDVRGPLVQATSDDPDVWVVACTPQAGQLVVVIYNDSRQTRKIDARLGLPGGTVESVTRTRPVWDASAKALTLSRETIQGSPRPGAQTHSLELAGRSVCKFTVKVDLPADSKPARVVRKQFFAREFIRKVDPDAPLKLPVKLDSALAARARRVWVRLVLRGETGSARMSIGGRQFPLPRRSWIVDIPLPEDLKLQPTTELVFTDTKQGTWVDMASIFVEVQQKAPE